MRRSLLLSAAVLTASAGVSSAALSAFGTTGTYDATTNANVVDAFVVGSGETYVGYTDAFAAAFLANTGGVINFDTQTITTSSVTDSTLSATFGIGQTLSMTGSTYNFQSAGVVGTPISGAGYMRVGNASGLQTYNFNMALTMVGVTVLTRTDFDRTITATVTYSNNTTASLPATLVAAGAANHDTFFGFTAPVGLTIKSLVVDGGNTLFFAVDDLAFITAPIPEPSVALLGAAGLAGMLVRRRRA